MPTLPTLPQATVDTTYSLPTGTTFSPADSAAFATALSNCALNDVIVLTAGVIYTGPFTLPNKASGSGWIYVTSSAYSNLPAPGVRVAISDATNMPIIEAGGSPLRSIITADTAHHFRFVGVRFRPHAGDSVGSLIALGNADTSATTLPHHIVFDRCYIHGDPTVGGIRGIAMNGNSIGVVDSYISDFKVNGSDTQTLISWNGQGPFKIFNNYLEASGENVMFGGQDPTITNLVPSDITIQRNYFFKPLSWIPLTWTVKNILEFKNAQRILVEGNVFENIWVAAQTGYLLNAKSVNQDGGANWSTVQDMTFRNNRGKNLENGLNLSGDEQPVATAPTRWLIENNELQIANVNGGAGYGMFLAQGNSPRYLTHLTIRHNTVVGIRNRQLHVEWETANGIVSTDVAIKDNLFEGGSEGLRGRDSTEGTGTLDDRMTNGTVTFNSWQGMNSANYGAASGSGNTMANNLFPATQAAIDFVNYAGANYRLNASSPLHNAASDGMDVGANIDLINAAITGTGSFCLFKWK